jgi:hypothetical protein
MYIYIILPAVLYAFEMYLMLREEQIEGFSKPKSFCIRGRKSESILENKIENFIILLFTKYLDEKNIR